MGVQQSFLAAPKFDAFFRGDRGDERGGTHDLAGDRVKLPISAQSCSHDHRYRRIRNDNGERARTKARIVAARRI